MTHELKTWPKYFRRIFELDKTFEIRKNDRDYQINDVLWLYEYDLEKDQYTGNECRRIVTYILHGPGFGIEDGYCIMSIKEI